MIAETRIEPRISALSLSRKKFLMNHIGKLLEKIIKESGYAVAAVAREVGVNTSTIFRWFDVPNLPMKHILAINKAMPNLNLKPVFDLMEEKLGYEIPENPYRKTEKEEVDIDPGIKISIDGEKYAGYAIPPDLAAKVREYIEEYQRKQQKKDK